MTIYYLTVSVGQEFRGSSAGWFLFRVSLKAAIRVLVKSAAIWRLADSWRISFQDRPLTWLWVGGFSLSPDGTLQRLRHHPRSLAVNSIERAVQERVRARRLAAPFMAHAPNTRVIPSAFPIPRKWVPNSSTQPREGIHLYLLKEDVSQNLWTCFKATTHYLKEVAVIF